MTAEKWQVALRIYCSAREKPVEQRRAFIESESQDPEILQQALELLQSGSEAESAPRSGTAPADRAGGQIGRYEIGALLGRGGMGEVYAGRDTELDRRVALKFFLADTLGDGRAVRRFIREAKAASTLNHPNIVTVYEVVRSESTLAIAMELVDGRPLSDLRGAPLACERVVDLGRQIASALAAAHEHGIVHRDVKPENLMLRRDGLVKVLDFGLAREVSVAPAGQTQTTEFDAPAGTPRYMSPEQLRGEPVTGSSDVFSLGVVLYELATGRRPFEAQYAWETAHDIVAVDPTPPAVVNPSIPRPLETLILAMLAKNPAARPQAREVARLLENGPRDIRLLPSGPGSESPLQGRHHKGAVPRQTHSSRRRMLAAALLSALAGLAAYVWMPGRNPRRDLPLTVVPLTTFGGSKDYPAFSPDGSRFAFSWNGGDARRSWRNIYMKQVGQGDPVQLTFSQNEDELPSWSPDGKWIAFCREIPGARGVSGRYAIYIVPASGGLERHVADGGRGVSWSTDGKSLVLANQWNGAVPPARESGGIFLLSLESGKHLALTSFHRDELPVFSPNGKWVAFTRILSGTAHEIYVVPAKGGTARRLTFDGQPTDGETWTADSREIVFASKRNGADGSLWRIPVGGGKPRPLSSTLRDAAYPSIPRLGGRLAYTEHWIDTNIYLRSGAGFAGAPVPGRFGEPAGILMSSREDHSPDLSPDGERLAFVSSRSGYDEIWVAHRDGTQPVQLTSLRAASTGTPRWSPDGRWIAFDSWAPANSAIYVVASDGGTPRRLSEEQFGSWMPFWSPDGRWIYFTCGRSGSRQIWKMPAEGGPAIQVTHGGAYEAKTSPDGTILYFTKQTGKDCCTIWSVPAGGGPEQPVAGLAKFDRITRSWGVLANGIYFISMEDTPDQVVRFFSFRTRDVSSLFALQKAPVLWVPGLVLSPDGRYALTVQLDHAVNDLIMIDNSP
jgi:Tol biopolymer transport system component